MIDTTQTSKLSTRQEKKLLSVIKLIEKSEKLQKRKEAKQRNHINQTPIIPQNPKKKIKFNSCVPSDGVSTTNLNECSSSSFDVLLIQEKQESVLQTPLQYGFNSAYGIRQQELFFYLMQYRNAQKQKELTKSSQSSLPTCELVNEVSSICECVVQDIQKTNHVFQKVANLFNMSKPSTLSMHMFKPKNIVKE